MRKYRNSVVAMSLVLLSAAGTVLADDAPAADAAKKPTGPSISDVLDASGITESGFIDAAWSYGSGSGSKFSAPVFDSTGTGTDTYKSRSYNTFTLQQAALTLAKQPTEGFGGLVNVMVGLNPYFPNYSPYSGAAGYGTANQFTLLQGFLQYATGPLTVIAGKFTTLAGAEVVAATGNTNVTRSLLFAFEPVTHTGVRATYAATDKINVIVGVNNGYNDGSGNQTSFDSGKTYEVGLAVTPNKAFSLTAQGYFGKEAFFNTYDGRAAARALIDVVATWNITSALTLVGSADWGQQKNANLVVANKTASWSGVAAYLNYAINDTWRVSLRGEYLKDQDGYLLTPGTGIYVAAAGANTGQISQDIKEATVTFGYDPTKNFELRLEGRYDTASSLVNTTASAAGTFLFKDMSQLWVEGLYKF